MFNLERLTVADIARLSEGMHESGAKSRSLEECGQRAVSYLYDNLVDNRGNKACALVRFFKTIALESLPDDLRRLADGSATGAPMTPATKCLVLLGTTGDLPQWNSRRESQGHQVLPLASPDAVARSPMISQLFAQFGIDVHAILQPGDELIVDLHERTYNVFFVVDANGSPFIPAQSEFVVPHGIKAVIGFGGVLPSGDVFATVLFTKVFVAAGRAELFRLLAVSMKTALLPFDWDATFAGGPSIRSPDLRK